MTTPRPFQRLRARRRGVIRRASLWDGGEYLLSVSGTAFSEQYRRYYYREIKAIVVQKGPRMERIGALMLLALVSMALRISTGVMVLAPWMHLLWITPLAWLVLIMYFNLTQSCRVFVYTAVSSEELPAILRRSAARRVVPQIVEKVRSAQGSFGDAYQEAAAHEAISAEIEPQPVPRPAPVVAVSMPAARRALYGAGCFFLALLGSAAFAFWYRGLIVTPKALLTAKVLFCVLNALGVATGVWALVSIFSIRMLNGLRLAIFVGLGLMALRSYALYFTLIELNAKRGLLSETMRGVRWRYWLGTGDCALSLLAAIAGLILLIYAWQGDSPGRTAEGQIGDGSVAGDSISSL